MNYSTQGAVNNYGQPNSIRPSTPESAPTITQQLSQELSIAEDQLRNVLQSLSSELIRLLGSFPSTNEKEAPPATVTPSTLHGLLMQAREVSRLISHVTGMASRLKEI